MLDDDDGLAKKMLQSKFEMNQRVFQQDVFAAGFLTPMKKPSDLHSF